MATFPLSLLCLTAKQHRCQDTLREWKDQTFLKPQRITKTIKLRKIDNLGGSGAQKIDKNHQREADRNPKRWALAIRQVNHMKST